MELKRETENSKTAGDFNILLSITDGTLDKKSARTQAISQLDLTSTEHFDQQ